ncbi:MAG: putative methyltransferase [Paraglaciecola sp.]|jgi:predicted methyltransferase
MNISHLLNVSSVALALILSTLSVAPKAQENITATLDSNEKKTLEVLIDSEDRSAKTRARNKYRHPLQTL